MRDEKFSEVASNARSDSGGRRRIKRARARARRCRGKYHELAGLSAAPSGIAAAIVTTRRATVVHLSAQVATSASALDWPAPDTDSPRYPNKACPRIPVSRQPDK